MRSLLWLVLCGVVVGAEPGPPPRIVYFDADGIPLPNGAVARLGTTRYRELTATRLHIAPHGKTAIASDDDNVRQWNLATGMLLKVWPLPERFRGYVSPDGRYALHLAERTATRDAGLDVWDVFQQKRLHTFAVEGVNGFVQATLSADAKTIATVDNTPREYRVRVWDMTTGKDRVIGAIEHEVGSLHFAAGDQRLLVSPTPPTDEPRPEQPVLAYDLTTDKVAYEIPKAKVLGVAVEGNLGLLGTDRPVLLNLKTGKAEEKQPATLFAFTPANFLTISEAHRTIVYSRSDGSLVLQGLDDAGHTRRVFARAKAAAFTPDGKALWLANPALREVDCTPEAQRIASGKERGPSATEGLPSEPTAFAWSHIPNVLVAKYDDRTVALDTRTSRAYAGFLPNVAWSNKATSFVAPSQQESLRLRQMVPGIPDEKGPISRHLTPSADGLVLVHRTIEGTTRVHHPGFGPRWDTTIGTFRTVRLHERYTGAELVTLPVDVVGDVAFSPDGQRLVTLETSGFRVWDAVTGKELLRRTVQGPRSPTGHAFGRGVAFAPNGQQLAIGNRDTTILLWELDLPEEITPALKLDDLLPLWESLASADAKVAWAAIKRLRSDPAKAIPLLCDRVQPVRPLSADVAKQLRKELEDDVFRVREAAMKKVYQHGDAAHGFLDALAKETISADLRTRVQTLQATFAPTNPARGDDLRALRALAVLQSFPRRPEVRTKLAELATGDPKARVTQEANAARQRLP